MQSDIANTITTSVQNIIGESCGSLKTPNLSISNIMKSTGAGGSLGNILIFWYMHKLHDFR